MAVTIKEIAAVVGVSRGTVDRVLHNRGGVKPDIAEHIRKVADTMGYLPNRAGKILAARKQPITVGCLIPSIGNPFYDDVIRGFRTAQEELADFGVTVKVKEIRGYDPGDHIRAIKELVDAGSSALCISTVDIAQVRAYVNQLIDSGIPVVTVNTDLSHTKRLCYVGSDYLKGGHTAAGLLSLCARQKLNLLIVTGSLKIKGHNERIKGFSRTLRENGVQYKLVDVFESQDDDNYAYKTALDILSKNPQINCVFIVAAGVAGVCRAIAELGLREKQRPMWVLSFDDVESTRRLVNDGIIDFTICQEPVQQGYQAIQILFNYFVDDKRTIPQNFLTGTVIKIKENL